MKDSMKIKKHYLLLLIFAIIFPIFYNQYGWIWNPWAAERLVWDEPNPELIGQTFSIAVPATYKDQPEFMPKSVRNSGATHVITLDTRQPTENKPYGQYYRIQPTDLFTIKKTYWIRINSWSKGFHTEKKFAIVHDSKNKLYIFNFLDFRYTNHPEYVSIKQSYDNQSPWDFKVTEIINE